MKARPITKSRGFTLIELLVVIGILAILLSIVLIAINPARQFAQANNTKRRSDTTAILNAISQYLADNKGVITPLGIPQEDPLTPASEALPICRNAAAPATCVDLCTLLTVTVQYLPALPADPQTNNGAAVTVCTADYTTGYSVVRDASNRVTVSAPSAELSETISIMR